MMAGMARGAQRVVIAGQGTTAQQMYDLMSERVGSRNVMRLETYRDAADVQYQARAFGADAILGVRPSISRTFPSIRAQRSSRITSKLCGLGLIGGRRTAD